MIDLSMLEGLTIRRPEDVRPAAIALRAVIDWAGDWRVAPAHSIALHQPMVDHEGTILATSVFGWTNSEEDRWWRSPTLALNSPLPEACRYEGEAFWCNAQGFYPQTPNPLLERIELKDFAGRAITNSAIVVPVHMPLGAVGAASIIPRQQSKTDLSKEFARCGELFTLAIRKFIMGYARTMAPLRAPASPGVLTKREVACLRWAAGGKTDVEIGMIMSRSRATVRFHIHNAAQKLDAVNRSQTVYKAAQLGYFDPRH
jgi:DNA-binding CsgD family transcriptional regulator